MKRGVASIANALKALTQKVERIAERLEKSENAQSQQKPVKKAAKSGGVAAPKKSPKKLEKTPRKPVESKATDHMSNKVLVLIQSTTGGLNTDQIMEQTGLTKRQVWDIVSKAKRAGKIKTANRGIYTAS
jgi:predicted Rossmann fold nucleotide-binding protein DprA/Smf involved in DNA uptake